MKAIKHLFFFLFLLGILSNCKKPEAAETGIIEGIITNAQTSEPIKGAVVTLGSSSSKTTGDDGKYRFDGLEPVDYTIQVKAEDFETNTKTIVVIAGTTKQGDFSLIPLVPILNTSTLSLDFGMSQMLPITITNAGKGTLSWSVSKNASWLAVNPSTGTTTSESSSLNVLIDRTGLTPKVYTTNIIINSNGGDANIMVSMLVQGPIPTAVFTVTPSAGALSQTFFVDASGSTDDIDPTSALFVHWRWDDNESYTPWVTLKTDQHIYSTESLKNITLEVKDSDGHVGTATKTVRVSNSLQLPYVTTIPVTNITGSTASCGGNVQSDGGSDVILRGVCWRTTPNPTIFDSKTTDGSGLGSFTSDITGLTTGTTYYICAYASNGIGTSYGNEISFIAGQNSSSPTVTTADVTDIKANTASSGGTVSSEGSSAVTSRGICWSTGANPTISDPHTTNGSGTGAFTSSITGLSATSIYHVRAYATNSSGTSYGNEIAFTTKNEITVPGVTTTNAYNITESSALSGGNVVSDGGETVVARGVCWSTNQNPTINDQHTSDGSGLGSFTSNITGLASSTPYYYRAYATNSAGSGYGSQKSFTTFGTFPSVTTNNITNITETSAIASGAVISTGGSSVSERGVCYSTGENPTIYDNKIASGSGTGGFSVPLNILIPNTIYYVRAYAINGNGTGYGDNKPFTTLDAYYEGFENGYPNTWSGIGWSVTTDGPPYELFHCMVAYQVNDEISFTRNVTTSPNGNISFYYKASPSFYNQGAETSFYIDNVLKATIKELNWTLHSYSIPTGTHSFKWKLVDNYNGENVAYIDYIIVSP